MALPRAVSINLCDIITQKDDKLYSEAADCAVSAWLQSPLRLTIVTAKSPMRNSQQSLFHRPSKISRRPPGFFDLKHNSVFSGKFSFLLEESGDCLSLDPIEVCFLKHFQNIRKDQILF